MVVAEQGSFSRAADELFLTQPAVSKRIVKLENQLKTRLFDRIGRNVSLTVAGQHLLPKARSIIESMENTADELTNLSGRVGGRLKIATSHHISLHRLPAPLSKFIALYPQVELDIQFAESEVIYEGVLQGRWQLGIITLTQNLMLNYNNRPFGKIPCSSWRLQSTLLANRTLLIYLN